MDKTKKIKQKYFRDIKEWRRWLEINHIKEDKIEVIRYKKHTGKPSPAPSELMHEAICFGWIDTTAKRLDEDRYIITYSKRSKKSRWSLNTQSYAKELIKLGKMSDEGLKHYKSGLKRPVLDLDAPENPEVPKDLIEELEKDKIAKENFNKFAPSYKRMLLRWIEKAKMKETRDRRINRVFEIAKINKKTL